MAASDYPPLQNHEVLMRIQATIDHLRIEKNNTVQPEAAKALGYMMRGLIQAKRTLAGEVLQ